MFETAELGRTLAKTEYDRILPQLRTDLLRVQNELYADAAFSVVVVIAGVDGAGKGPTVNRLHEWMDPRFLEAHAFGPASDEERERPDMWRFWRLLPPRGRIGIFFGSWYTFPILQRVHGEDGDGELDAALRRIVSFERGLVEDGTLLLKYWFHLSRKEQKKRLTRLSRDKRQRWRVTETDWKHFKLYDKFASVSERALRVTSTGEAPWTVVEGLDRRYRETTVARHLLDAVTQRTGNGRRRDATPPALAPPDGPTILGAVDLAAKLPAKQYREELERWQGRLGVLAREASARGVSAALVFEGWDAAGKGGAIRRVNRALDARYYRVIPVAAPSDEELARHYLWRFWRKLPRAGQIIVFDRSWYGRVLVERVEGFASAAEWQRAYWEINEFEEQLYQHGIALAKFWLHLDPDEQLARFKAREATPYKQFKITAEDYRNRERWPAYDAAVNEMVERTSTSYAPWTLVAANDKRHARIQVLKTVHDTLAAAVKRTR